jgi:CDP-glucose 4,6-dehydratase
MIRGLLCGKSIRVREPQAVRPWQHVLDPLHGYLLLAEKLYEEGARWAEAWNFGPDHTQPLTVGEIASELLQYWGAEDFLNPNPTQYARTEADESTGNHKPHEAGLLLLDSNKAKSLLGWRPLLDTRSAIRWTVDWYKAYAASESNARDTTLKQIQAYESLYDIHPKHSGLPMPHSPLN